MSTEELHNELERLPAEARALIERHALLGESYATLADELGLCSATVGTRLFRARGKLRSALLTRFSGARQLDTADAWCPPPARAEPLGAQAA